MLTPLAAGAKVEGEDVEGGGRGGWRGADSAVDVAANEGTAASAGKQLEQKPSPERAPDVILQNVGDEKSSSSNNDGGGNNGKLNRERRSSSIPWVQEAANGKHYRSPSLTKTTVEPAIETLTGRRPPDGTARRPSSSPSHAEGQQHGGSNTASGSAPEGTAEPKPTSAPQEVAESAASKQTALREPVVAGSHRASINSSGRENNTANRGTSSISWAEGLVAGLEENGASSSSPEAAAVTASRPADSNGNGTGNGTGSGLAGDGDNSTSIRQTSSISWTEDIVTRTGEEAVHTRESAAA